jgi:hypothetical protein
MTTAVTIAPSKLSNVMALPSQAGAGVQIERRDGKGRHAYGNKDKVENEAEHWRSFPAQFPNEPVPASPENTRSSLEDRECRI